MNRLGPTLFGDDAASWASATPTPGALTIDATPPTVAITPVSPDPRSAPVDSINITFSEKVTGFDPSDLTLTLNGGANLLTASQTLTTSDGGTTWSLVNLTSLTAALGDYTLSLNAAGSGITDLAGNALAAGATDMFSNLAPQWTGPGGGSFKTDADWSNGAVPNGTDAAANFLSGDFGITGPSTVSIDSPVTLGSIVFDNSNGYTLTGAGNITFSSSTTPTIDVVSGNQTITGPLNAPNADMTIGEGASLTVDQFDLNTLVIGAGGVLTIAPSGSGNPSAAIAAKAGNSSADSAAQSTTTTTTTTVSPSPDSDFVSAPISVSAASLAVASVPSCADRSRRR